MKRFNATGAVLIPLLLAGCAAVGPDFKRPAIATPSVHRGELAADADRSLADLAWWDIYRDPQLASLIRAALADGYDARLAAARVDQARAIAAQVHGDLVPAVGYNANADRGRNASLGNANPNGTGATTSGFDGYFEVAWEADLWGRVRRLDEAARSQYLATADAQRWIWLSITSQVATSYYELLELDAELAIARDETDSFRQSLDLFTRQLNGGVASRLETASAEAAMDTSAARIPALEQAIALKEDQLSVLIGHNPGPITRGAALADQTFPPVVPAGLPSQLLERRPDIREAEELARAANAGIGVTVGGFLPRIGLSALLGAVSPELGDIAHRRAGLWSVGANFSGPLFQGGGLRGQYEEAKAVWEEAKIYYEQKALGAFGEVADALVSRQKLALVRVQQENAVKAYQDAVDVAKQRYALGTSNYYEVLQTQQLLYPAEVALAQTRRDEFTAVVQLYKALGGGWNQADPAPSEKKY